MKVTAVGLTLLAMGLLGIQAAHADSMRCGDKLAYTGATLYEVKSICGTPDDAQHRIETHTVTERASAPCLHPEDQARCSESVSTTIEVVVDEWTNDLGANRFLRFNKRY